MDYSYRRPQRDLSQFAIAVSNGPRESLIVGHVRPVLPDPRLNVVFPPHPAHGEFVVGRREVGPLDDLPNARTAHPETNDQFTDAVQVAGHLAESSQAGATQTGICRSTDYPDRQCLLDK